MPIFNGWTGTSIDAFKEKTFLGEVAAINYDPPDNLPGKGRIYSPDDSDGFIKINKLPLYFAIVISYRSEDNVLKSKRLNNVHVSSTDGSTAYFTFTDETQWETNNEE